MVIWHWPTTEGSLVVFHKLFWDDLCFFGAVGGKELPARSQIFNGLLVII